MGENMKGMGILYSITFIISLLIGLVFFFIIQEQWFALFALLGALFYALPLIIYLIFRIKIIKVYYAPLASFIGFVIGIWINIEYLRPDIVLTFPW